MAERTFIEMEWLRKERIRELLRNFSNHLRMARRVNSTGMPCVSANFTSWRSPSPSISISMMTRL